VCRAKCKAVSQPPPPKPARTILAAEDFIT
jgi:hypothetical protein